MNELHDRLAAIKAQRQAIPNGLPREDADWLIAEVERLQEVLVELLKTYVRLYALVERICAQTITPQQTLQELQALKQQPDEPLLEWRERLDGMVDEQQGEERLAAIHDLAARRDLSRFFRHRG